MLENKWKLEIIKGSKKIYINFLWAEREHYEKKLYIDNISVDNKIFDFSIHKCKLINVFYKGEEVRAINIKSNIKDRNTTELFNYLSGSNKKENDNITISILDTYAEEIDKYIERCEAMQTGESNKEDKKEEEFQKFFETARSTGKKQLIKKWIEPCNDKNEECNLDMVYLYAMPNGMQKKIRQHTW